MSADTLTSIDAKLKTMFEASAIKTVGDLAQAQGIKDWEKLPGDIKDFSLEPRGPLAFPSGFFYLMDRSGFPSETSCTLAEAISIHQMDNLRSAIAELSPPSNHL